MRARPVRTGDRMDPFDARRMRQGALIGMAAGAAGLPALLAASQPAVWALLPALAAFGASILLARAPAEPDPLPMPAGVDASRGPLPAPGANPAPLPALGAAAVEAFALPLLLTDADEAVTAASAAAHAIFPGLVPGRPVTLAIRDPDFLDALDSTRRDGASRSVTLGETVLGARTMRASLSPLWAPGAAAFAPAGGVVSVFEDLTEQRATERMRVDFIANASHELRTPLASLLGFIETLQGPARDDPKARERFLPIMREQAGRMARLIDDLLSLSRAELRAHQQPVSPIDLNSIVREIVDSLGLSARERGVALEVSLPATPSVIRGDRDDLLRIVENLVENGIRYGRDGKRVEIALARLPGALALGVTDHGPGIAPEHLPRLTERFYRADISHSREIGGTGLGLAIVKHLAARHRARLEIDSKPGAGATFKVIFPSLDG